MTTASRARQTQTEHRPALTPTTTSKPLISGSAADRHAEPIHRLPIRQALNTLQHHHHRHDHRRHAAAAHIGEQVREHLIREQLEALPVQHTINRVRVHPVLTEVRRRPPQIRLNRRASQRHPPIQLQQSRSAGHRHAKTPRPDGVLAQRFDTVGPQLSPGSTAFRGLPRATQFTRTPHVM